MICIGGMTHTLYRRNDSYFMNANNILICYLGLNCTEKLRHVEERNEGVLFKLKVERWLI